MKQKRWKPEHGYAIAILVSRDDKEHFELKTSGITKSKKETAQKLIAIKKILRGEK